MSGLAEPVVKFEKKENVGVVTLNRPEALNALTRKIFNELGRIFEEISADKEIKAVIITGSGEKAFAAGSDIKEMLVCTPLEAREFVMTAYQAQEKISSLPKPTIAAINGYALGGGCELALCCDLRIATENSRFGQPEINLGIIPGGGGTQRLARLIGVARAKELIFTGKIISAREALDWGLVNQVVPSGELMEAAIKLAQELAGKSVSALVWAKCAIDQGYNLDLNRALFYEIECFTGCFATEDHREGMTAFLEKRKPLYKGR